MNDIKKISDDFLNTPPTSFERFVTFTGFSFLYDIESFYQTYKERIERSIAFARIGWLNYDFESQYLYDLMAFKLKRVLYTIETYGHHVEDSDNMDALRESIEICNRLFVNQYEDQYLDKHDEKWGPLTYSKFSPNESIFKRANAITKEQKELELIEFMECDQKGQEDRSKDIYRLAQLLDKHQASWWD
jgi:hypothetical protein